MRCLHARSPACLIAVTDASVDKQRIFQEARMAREVLDVTACEKLVVGSMVYLFQYTRGWELPLRTGRLVEVNCIKSQPGMARVHFTKVRRDDQHGNEDKADPERFFSTIRASVLLMLEGEELANAKHQFETGVLLEEREPHEKL